MRLNKLISFFLVSYTVVNILERIFFEYNLRVRYATEILIYFLPPYVIVPLMAIWFFKNNAIKKGAK